MVQIKKRFGSSTKKTAKKTTKTYSRRKSEHRLVISEAKTGLPQRYPVRLRYCTNDTITSTVGVGAIKVYSLNSLFDPDVSNVGHQPLYYDQFSALYDRYQVDKTEIIVSAITIGANPWIFMVYASQVNNASSFSVEALREQKNCYWKVIPGNGAKATIKHKFSIPSLLGLSKSAMTSPQYLTQVATNPTDMLYVTVIAATLNGTTDSIYIETELQYHNTFSTLLTIAQS